MGLKRSAARLYLRTSARVRPPRHARVMAGVLRLVEARHLLDVGANRGQFGSLMRRVGFAGDLLSVEPVGDAYAQLVAAAAGDDRWRTVQAAVGAAPGRLTIHVAGNSVSSSVLPMGARHLELAPESAYQRDEEVDVVTVADLVAQHGFDPARTMLKADVQGFEPAVLDGAGDLLGELAVLQLELSLLELYDGQALLPELVTRLDRAGYALWTFFPAFYDRANGRMWWADGLFVRKDLAERFPYRARG